MLSQIKSQTKSTKSLEQKALLAKIVNLPFTHRNLLKYIFLYCRRYKCNYASLTHFGKRINRERSHVGRVAHVLEFLGLISRDHRSSKTFCWFLSEDLLAPSVYAFLVQYFQGWSINSIISKLPLDQRYPQLTLIINKQLLKRGSDRANGAPKSRGSSPRRWRMWDDDIARQTKGRYSTAEFLEFIRQRGMIA